MLSAARPDTHTRHALQIATDLFSEFDGMTDRIPIEVLFGLIFAWLATKFVGGVYRDRKERSARLTFIWARSHHFLQEVLNNE